MLRVAPAHAARRAVRAAVAAPVLGALSLLLAAGPATARAQSARSTPPEIAPPRDAAGDTVSADEGPARGRARLVGRVRDAEGTPLGDVELTLLGVPPRREADRSARSREDGAYRMDDLQPGQYFARVRRLGYTPLQFSVTLARGEARTIDVELQRLPQMLSQVEIRDRSGFGSVSAWRMRDFDRRRRVGFGRFLTRDDLKRLAGGSLYGALRTQWPLALCPDALDPFGWGAAAGRAWEGETGRRWGAAGIGGGVSRGCSVTVSIDGMLPVGADMAGDLPLEWVEAVEIYRGMQAPLEFGFDAASSGRNGFLVIVWTGNESADDGPAPR